MCYNDTAFRSIPAYVALLVVDRLPMATHRISVGTLVATLCSLVFANEPGLAGGFAVVSTAPAARSLSAPVDTSILVRFNRPIRRDSVVARRSFWAFGRWSGPVDGTFRFLDGDRTVVLVPDKPLSAGEQVMVILSHDIESTGGKSLRNAGYSFQFWTNARRAPLELVEIDRLTARSNQQQPVRVYGGFATDLDRDGFLDITAVNEDSADLRVFLNKADRSGLFEPFKRPPDPVGRRCSPSEPTDFNHDGLVDACVANINDNTVSVVLGRGDGTFNPQQLVRVGSAPRGIAVLDVDGDGDTDIVNTNSGGAGNMSVLINNGDGVFGPASFFEGGGASEWALAAGDMNHDGILDLVIGTQTSQQMIVSTGNGDGTFTTASIQSAGGRAWMLALGDVDGNGTEDVAVGNGSSNRGAILLGDGAGNLAPPRTYVTDPMCLASDLGDLDGDDDLDWVTASFRGDWIVFLNNGDGSFTFDRRISAPRAASDSLLMDFDNDGDLDLGLIDEIADVIILLKNSGTANFPGDADGNCRVNLADYRAFADCMRGPAKCADPDCAVFDFNDDCNVDSADFARFQNAFTGFGGIPGCDP